MLVEGGEAPRDPVSVDLHSDTLSRILESGLDAGSFLEGAGRPGGLHADLPGARAAGMDALVLAAFVEGKDAAAERAVLGAPIQPAGGSPGGWFRSDGPGAALEMAGLLRRIAAGSGGRVRAASSAEEILENRRRGALSLLFALENAAEACDGRPAALEAWRHLGALFAGLVWYARNAFGSGVGERSDPGGLSSAGREAVEVLGRIGMAVDVSHLNPAGVRDVLAAAAGPVIATHSNARALCDHPRNLTDDQIREIAARGGVIGLCLFPRFLRPGGPATAEDAARHLEHIASVGGIGCIASGSDFDGIHAMPEGISSLADLRRIDEALRGRGWSEPDIRAWRGENAFRVLSGLRRLP